MTVSNNSLVINFKQLAEGTERPWSVYQYMKLREAARIHPCGDGRCAADGRFRKASPDREIFSDYCAQLMGNATSHRDLKIY